MSTTEREFGRTGEKITTLSMGCGFPWGFAGFDKAVETVRRALARGITYFDTSVLYRHGASQAIVGEALAEQKPGHRLATKIGHFRDARFFRSPEAMMVQFREGLRQLRRESVDLLQVHEADWENWWVDRPDVGVCELFDEHKSYDFRNAPVISFLHEAREKGLCRWIGITGNNARHLGRLIKELDGLDSVMIAYNYMPLNVTARRYVLPAAREKGMAVIVAGIYTFIKRIPAGWRTEGTYFGKRSDAQLAALGRLQKDCGMPMEELALRFVAADQAVTSVCVGACLPEQVDANIKAFGAGGLPSDLHAAMERIAGEFERLN